MRNCIECGEEYDPNSIDRKQKGGKYTVCGDCAIETAVKYAGVQAADGKQAQATILKFSSETDKNKYISFWKNNSGYNKGKSCQLGKHLSTTPAIQFQTIVHHKPTNHKGKSD